MKLHKLLLILSFMLFSVGNTFAQNNDMKARMEFEDAETAYQSQDYQKAVTHLESAEKLLGKPTGKTRYLLILALNKRLPVDYEYQDLEKIKKLSKHYLDNYTTDTEKYREIYDLSNNLDKNYPKSLNEYQQLQIQKNERKKDEIVEIEIKRNNFLNYKAVTFYEDGKDIKSFTAYNFQGKYSYKDKVTKKKFYIYPIDYDKNGKSWNDGFVQFLFNENKLSYMHLKIYSYYTDITISQIEKMQATFLQDMKNFSESYSLTPEIIKNNSEGESLTYKFSYKYKTVEFVFGKSTYKDKPSCSKSIRVTNHNYENKS